MDRDHESISPNAQDPLCPEGGILPSFTQEGASNVSLGHWQQPSQLYGQDLYTSVRYKT